MLMEQISVLGFWNRVDEVREDSIEAMARGTGISQGTIRNLRSRKMLPNLADTVAISDYLHVTLDWLVLGRVTQDKSSDVNEILKSYLESDDLTRLLVKRALGLL